MSWQAYVDNLVASTKVDKAAIYSRAGDSVWAQSVGFSLSTTEISEIVSGFDNSSGLQAKGLHAQGIKYFLLRADDRSIYGKKGAEGLVIVRTKQTILIGHYPEGVQPGEATKIVEQLADYLISVGY
ncbi:profilin [Lipomyces kononenkoae]|uniref:Profilin n=1 Tax=Lipomyces kononenkoae TaxID=34357 RepID=A0ACC3T2R9_LIPKO